MKSEPIFVRKAGTNPVDEGAKRDIYHIAAEFLRLSATERQLIARQVMAAQLDAQRRLKSTR